MTSKTANTVKVYIPHIGNCEVVSMQFIQKSDVRYIGSEEDAKGNSYMIYDAQDWEGTFYAVRD